jgi:hypothetical protein
MNRRRVFDLAAAFILLAVVGLVVITSDIAVWDGQFKLRVVQSRSSQSIRRIDYVFASGREEADWISQNDCEADHPFKMVEEFDGGAFVVNVPCSGRRWCGVNYGYVEPYRFLVFRVDYGIRCS